MNTNSVHPEPGTPPPKQILHWQRALLWHGLGFAMLLVLTWCDALIDLTNYIRGLPPRSPDINEVAMKTVVIIFLWMGSAYKLYRIVSRLSYLEKFLHVCAWCRKIQHQDVWLSLEEHFQQKSGGAVSHGICPQCAERFKSEAVGMSKGR